MEKRKESERDQDRELQQAPFNRQGFTDRLRQQIESELDRHTARKPIFRRLSTFAFTLCGAALALSLLFLLPDSLAVPATSPPSEDRPSDGDSAAVMKANAAESSLSPLSSALLIGFRQDHEAGAGVRNGAPSIPTSTYRTLLIAPNCSGKLAVAAEGPGILMPYRQWFWKIDAVNRETYSGTYHYLIARQADQPMKPDTFSDDPSLMLRHSEKLMYASNQYVSVAETESAVMGDSPAEYKRISVKKVTQLGMNRVTNFAANKKDANRVTLQDVYGSEAGEVLTGMLRNRSAAGNSSALSGDSWTIRRKPGHWMAAAAETFVMPNNQGEGYELWDFSLPLPETATSFDTLGLTWSDILKAQPKAKDALTSPIEDIAAVFSGNWLYVYAYSKPLDRGPLLAVQLQPDETMVMAQWATGGYVEEWVHKARTYLKPAPGLPAEDNR